MTWNWDASGFAWQQIGANPLPSGNYKFRMFPGDSLAQVGNFTIDPQQSGTWSIGTIRFAEGQKDDLPVNMNAPGQSFKYGIKAVYAFFETWYAPKESAFKIEWYYNGAFQYQRTGQGGGGVVNFDWESHFYSSGSPLETGNWEVRIYIDNRLVQRGTFVIEQ